MHKVINLERQFFKINKKRIGDAKLLSIFRILVSVHVYRTEKKKKLPPATNSDVNRRIKM